MAMRNPVGRVNYQPNSWGEGPRESPERGFRSFADAEEGAEGAAARRRASPTTTARRGSSSSARRRPSSSTSPMALTFELSKVETPAIRERMVVASAQHRRGAGRDGRRQARPEDAAEAGRRRDADRGRIWSRRRRSASSRTARTASKAASSACWSPTAPMPRC